jgi:tRNA threonylcarbamoyl adenosine modification protein (Sua5/YciO/YrdC/YwlC family)
MAEIFQWPSDRRLPDEFLARLKIMLDGGMLIVYPTSTLYGLGASIRSVAGINFLNDVKARPPGMPISIMASAGQVRALCRIPESAGYFMDSRDQRITAVLPALEDAPGELVHNGTLAVRLSCDELTASLVESVGPITATSANVHAASVPGDIPGAVEQLGDSVSVYIDSGTLAGKPTTLIDYTGPEPKIIREGALSALEAEALHGR